MHAWSAHRGTTAPELHHPAYRNSPWTHIGVDSTTPQSLASRYSSISVLIPSFWRMSDWLLATVFTLRLRRLAISSCLLPPASKRDTSNSRDDRPKVGCDRGEL